MCHPVHYPVSAIAPPSRRVSTDCRPIILDEDFAAEDILGVVNPVGLSREAIERKQLVFQGGSQILQKISTIGSLVFEV